MAPSIWQILLIVLVVLLIFGAGKLPQVMGDMAKGVKNFKKGLEEDDNASSKSASKSTPKEVSDQSVQEKTADEAKTKDNA